MTGPTQTPAARDVAAARRHSTGDLLRRTALRHPNKTALIDADRRLTYREFDAAANRYAHAMADLGLSKGDRLALLSRNSWQYAVIVFAAARLGVVLVPLNFTLGSEEISYILNHSRAAGMIAQEALVPTAEQALAAADLNGGVRACIPGPDGLSRQAGWVDVDTWIDSGSSEAPDVPIEDDDPLRLMYTSGTESRPKGVLLSSRSLISQYVSCALDGDMHGDDIEIHALPLYHCAQLDCFLSVDVYLGATSVILPGPDPTTLLETVERDRVTKLFCPPTVWISLLRHPAFDSTDLSSLQKGYYGASPMPVEVLRELQERLPNVALRNFYGQTEMSPVATILQPDEQFDRAGSAGRPALNVETRVVDDDDVPVGPGVVGEIVHRSPHATAGYVDDDTATSSAFRNGWFHSGDLGVVDPDGYLTVVDRKKDMIKTGGENVASREVEETIYALPDVAEVAVFGVSHPHWIEAVTAVVVAREGSSLTDEHVREHTARHLAPYKRPKYVVLAPSLPKNPSGKILKRELRATYGHLADASGAQS